MTEILQLTGLMEKCSTLKYLTISNDQVHSDFPGLGVSFVLDEFTKRVNNEALIEDMRFITSEMISNAFYYGNQFNKDKKIMIYCGWIKNNFYGVVQDEGEGFDINNPHYHASPPDGGMGIELSRKKVDLLYNFGNAVFFVKKVI